MEDYIDDMYRPMSREEKQKAKVEYEKIKRLFEVKQEGLTKEEVTKKTVEQRFWDKVRKSEGCWQWTGYCNEFGHGCFNVSGVIVRAHRFSYELHNGKVAKELNVLHKCDNPPCVNPEHLYIGTQQNNMEDMVNRGRSLTGEKHHKAKLTVEQVREIRSKYVPHKHGKGAKELAEKYGVGVRTINAIITNQSWKIK